MLNSKLGRFTGDEARVVLAMQGENDSGNCPPSITYSHPSPFRLSTRPLMCIEPRRCIYGLLAVCRDQLLVLHQAVGCQESANCLTV